MTADERRVIDELAATMARMETKHDTYRAERRVVEVYQSEKLATIEKLQAVTNGRVNGLEAWRDRVGGAVAAAVVLYGVVTDLFGLLSQH